VLDAAVRERLSAGATVLFVDHDPARLADRVDERWQLGGGAIRVTVGRQRPAAADQPAGNATMRIELAGLEPGSVQQLARLPGVVAIEPGAEPALPILLTVHPHACDAVLRAVLSWEGVQVRAVRP
jgi:ABC-2 type transport system ATP-binding protein